MIDDGVVREDLPVLIKKCSLFSFGCMFVENLLIIALNYRHNSACQLYFNKVYAEQNKTVKTMRLNINRLK